MPNEIKNLPLNPPLEVKNSRFPLPTWNKKLWGFDNYHYVINGLTKGFPIGIDPEKIKDTKKFQESLNLFHYPCLRKKESQSGY